MPVVYELICIVDLLEDTYVMNQANPSNKGSKVSLIKMVEEIMESLNWECEHICEDEIALASQQDWGMCFMEWTWIEDWQILTCAATTNYLVPEDRQNAVSELLMALNEHLWVGHFDFSCDGYPSFRHSLLLEGLMQKQCYDLIEKTLEIALKELKRVQAMVQCVVWGGQSPERVVGSAFVETMGEA